MKIIEGNFGKPTSEEEEKMADFTSAELSVFLLNEAGIGEDINVNMIVITSGDEGLRLVSNHKELADIIMAMELAKSSIVRTMSGG